MAKIMIVDDNEKILTVTKEILQEEGHEVVVADSGKRSLDLLKREKPDLLLMDVMMPDMDGWETVKMIKKDPSNKDIRISMLTVKSRDEDRAKSLVYADADWHISKPFSKKRLVETVDWLLSR